MQCIAPLRPLIIWSRGSPLSPSLIQSSFDGKVEPVKVEFTRRIRQETPYSVMQFGRFPSSAISATRRLRHENLSYFEEPKEEPTSDIFHFVEWRTGRQLDIEETRSAIIFRLSALHEAPEKGHVNRTILTCLAKVTTADTQMNDITESKLVVYPREPSRSQWKKVHDADHVMVEDKWSNKSPIHQKYMKHQKLKTNLGHYIKKISKVPLYAPIIECICYAENRSLNDILHRVSYTTGLQIISGITYTASNSEISREFHVCSTQRFRFIGMTKEAIQSACRKYNLFPVLLTPVNYRQNLQIQSFGTQYTIALREVAIRTVQKPMNQFSAKSFRGEHQNPVDCFQNLKAEISERLHRLRTECFINYFPVQVIGGGGVALYQLGVHFLRNELVSVLRGYLQLEAERHPVSYEHYIQCVGAPVESLQLRFVNWANALRAFRDCVQLQGVLESIVKLLERNFSWDEIAQNIVNTDEFLTMNISRYIKAFQGYIWNCRANRRLQKSFGLSSARDHKVKVHIGDIVRSKVVKDGELYYQFSRIKNEEAAADYCLEDVVIPEIDFGSELTLPHLHDEINIDQMYDCDRAEHKTLLSHFGICSFHLKKIHTTCIWSHFSTKLRSLLAKPENLAWYVSRDPNSSIALKTDLFCLQEGNIHLNSPYEYTTHENETLVSSIDGEAENPETLLDLHKRIRPPSPFNHSPRLQETLQFIQMTNDKSRSIKVTPSPGVAGTKVHKMNTLAVMPYRRDDRCTLLLRFSLPSGSSVSIFLRELFDVVYYKQFGDLM